MIADEPVSVECYSGYTYAQEPQAFVWQGKRHKIALIDRAWQSPEGPCFLVWTETGERFRLSYDIGKDRWLARLESRNF